LTQLIPVDKDGITAVPTASSKLIFQWKSVGDVETCRLVNYRVKFAVVQVKTFHIHINTLKYYHEREEESDAEHL